jgi:hypothetical protein
MGKDTSHKTSATIGVHKLLPKAGMFVKAKVNCGLANLLIYTRVTIAILNTQLYRQMSNTSLYPSQRETISANGESIKLLPILSLKYFSVEISL